MLLVFFSMKTNIVSWKWGKKKRKEEGNKKKTLRVHIACLSTFSMQLLLNCSVIISYITFIHQQIDRGSAESENNPDNKITVSHYY